MEDKVQKLSEQLKSYPRLWVPSPYETAKFNMSSENSLSKKPLSFLTTVLREGIVLCRLANLVTPGSVPKINTDISRQFLCKENLFRFLTACRTMGAPPKVLFMVSDVFGQKTNLETAMDTIFWLIEEANRKQVDLSKQVSSPTVTSTTSAPKTTASKPAAPRKLTKAEHRGKVVQELKETERSYLNDLALLRSTKMAVETSKIYSSDDVFLMFGNIEQLQKLHIRFLKELEQEEEHLGILLQSWSSEFHIYTAYCSNHDAAMDKVVADSSALVKLNLPIPGDYNLPSYVIKPIQRICKYPLLIKEILKFTETSDPEYESLQKAHSDMHKVTMVINELRKRRNDMKAVVELESKLLNWRGCDLRAYGSLKMDQALFLVKEDASFENVHVFILDKIFLYGIETFGEQSKLKRMSSSGNMHGLTRKSSSGEIPGGEGGGSSKRKQRWSLSLGGSGKEEEVTLDVLEVNYKIRGRIALRNNATVTDCSEGNIFKFELARTGDSPLSLTFRVSSKPLLEQILEELGKCIDPFNKQKQQHKEQPQESEIKKESNQVEMIEGPKKAAYEEEVLPEPILVTSPMAKGENSAIIEEEEKTEEKKKEEQEEEEKRKKKEQEEEEEERKKKEKEEEEEKRKKEEQEEEDKKKKEQVEEERSQKQQDGNVKEKEQQEQEQEEEEEEEEEVNLPLERPENGCGYCNQVIASDEPHILADKTPFHPAHFLCSLCNQELSGKTYYQVDSRFLCQNDYHTQYSNNCPQCGELVTTDYIQFLGENYHAEHFSCVICSKNLVGEAFIEYEGQPFCEPHYNQQVMGDCHRCGLGFYEGEGGGGVTEILLQGDNKYHSQCFTCFEGCGLHLNGQRFLVEESQIYCSQCGNKRKGNVCFACEKVLVGTFTVSEGKKLHDECLVCEGCKKNCKGKPFAWHDKVVYCFDCRS
eukprot:Lithocolla_globosa_v1_NODE_871_length_3160_cov_39.907568.p1 type:complete len:930 gc:universal NODE_871_length_3160_cov_39.907568:147-2936(+)